MFGHVHLVDGQTVVPIRSAKCRALVAYCALSARPVSRDSLAWLLWRTDGRRNLRQLLYQARQLPHAEDWLLVDADSVSTTVACDGQQLLCSTHSEPTPTGLPLEGLDDVGTEAFTEWVLETRERLNDARDRASLASAAASLAQAPEQTLRSVQPLVGQSNPPLAAVRLAIQAHQALGHVAQARALWEQVTERIAQRPATEQAEWASLRLSLNSEASPAIAGIIPRLRTLLALEPKPLPPTVIADVLGVQLIDVAAAWASIDPSDAPATDLASSALRARLAQALQDHGEHARAAEHWMVLGDNRRAADLWWSVGLHRDDLSALEQCARASAPLDATRSDTAWSLAAMGWRVRRDLHQAKRVADAMMTHATASQQPMSLARARFNQAACAVLDQRTDDLTFSRNELASLATAHPEARPILSLIDGLRAALKRDMDNAVTLLTEALDGGQVEQLQALLALGACHGFAGRLDSARQVHAEGLALSRTLGSNSLATAFLNGLSSTANLADDLHMARRHMLELLELRKMGVGGMVVRFAAHNLAVVDIALGKLGEARRMLAESLHDSPVSTLRAATFRTRSELERVVGRFAEAAAWSERARALYEELDLPADVEITVFNTALATYLLTPTAAALTQLRQAAASVIERGGIYGGLVAADMCMVESSPDAIDTLLASLGGIPAVKRTVIDLRHASLSGRDIDLAQATSVISAHTSAASTWGRAMLATLQPDRASTLREQSNAVLAQMCEGLLTSQVEALTELHTRWWTNPTENVCTF